MLPSEVRFFQPFPSFDLHSQSCFHPFILFSVSSYVFNRHNVYLLIKICKSVFLSAPAPVANCAVCKSRYPSTMTAEVNEHNTVEKVQEMAESKLWNETRKLHTQFIGLLSRPQGIGHSCSVDTKIKLHIIRIPCTGVMCVGNTYLEPASGNFCQIVSFTHGLHFPNPFSFHSTSVSGACSKFVAGTAQKPWTWKGLLKFQFSFLYSNNLITISLSLTTDSCCSVYPVSLSCFQGHFIISQIDAMSVSSQSCSDIHYLWILLHMLVYIH